MSFRPSSRRFPWLVLLCLAVGLSICLTAAHISHTRQLETNRWFSPVPAQWTTPTSSTSRRALCSFQVCQSGSRSYPFKGCILYAGFGPHVTPSDTESYTLDVRGLGAPWPFLFVREHESVYTSEDSARTIAPASSLAAATTPGEIPLGAWSPLPRHLPLGAVSTAIHPTALAADLAIALVLGSGLWYAAPRLWYAASGLRSRWRTSRGLCPTCAYDLTASPPGPCPECGHTARAST